MGEKRSIILSMERDEIKEAEVFRLSILLVGKEALLAKQRLLKFYGEDMPLKEIFGKIKKHLPEPCRVLMPPKLIAEIESGNTTMKDEDALFAEKQLDVEDKNDERRLPRIMYKKGAYMIKSRGKTYYWVDLDEYNRFEAADPENRFLSPVQFSDTAHRQNMFYMAKKKIDEEFPVERL